MAPCGDDPAAGDDHDVLADVLDEVELVAREDDPDAGRRPLAEDLGHRRDADRVEAGERLVEDEQLRVVDERRASWTRCWLPCDSASSLTCARSARPIRSSQRAAAASRRLAGMPVVLGEVAELLADAHPRVEAALLGHVAEAQPGRRGRSAGRATADLAAVRVGRGRRCSASSSSCRRRWGRGSRRSARARRVNDRAVEGDDVAVALREVHDLRASRWAVPESTRGGRPSLTGPSPPSNGPVASRGAVYRALVRRSLGGDRARHARDGRRTGRSRCRRRAPAPAGSTLLELTISPTEIDARRAAVGRRSRRCAGRCPGCRASTAERACPR